MFIGVLIFIEELVMFDWQFPQLIPNFIFRESIFKQSHILKMVMVSA